MKTSHSFALAIAALLPALAQAQTPFVPNDPYFFPGTDAGTAPGYYGQWYLKNNMPISDVNAGQDINVTPVWNAGITGAGVVIQIIDDGVEATHPDLQANFSNQYSYSLDLSPAGNAAQTGTGADPDNYRGGALVSGVGSAGNNHGTAVAGIAGAAGGNGIGVTGVAPAAKIASINFLAGGTDRPYATNQNEALAILYQGQTDAEGNPDISAVYTGTVIAETPVRVKNHSYGPSPSYNTTGAGAKVILDALSQSSQIGVINSFAAGNQRNEYPTQDANTILESTSANQITVAALGSNGKYASYSDFGANVVVTAPSNSFEPDGLFAQATTDRVTSTNGYNLNPAEPDKYFLASTGSGANAGTSYASDFGGTSGATPVISGIMALGVEANPNLTVRMAKQILARTSVMVDSEEVVVAPVSGSAQTSTQTGGWVTRTVDGTQVKGNAAGVNFNNNYGFGLADASAFVAMAQNVTSYQSGSFPTSQAHLPGRP